MTVLFEVEDFTRKIYEVTGSTAAGRGRQMTVLFKVEDFTRKIYEVTGSPTEGRGRQMTDWPIVR